MKNGQTSLVGIIYYRYTDNNELEMIRVTRVKNKNKIICKKEHLTDKNTVEYETHTLQELDDKYIKLESDGVIIFNGVTLRNAEDVLVSLMRKEDMSTKAYPYAVCRQNIKDFFEFLIKGDYEKCGVGMSVSLDTIPNGCDYASIFRVDSIICTDVVNFYITDSLKDILSLVSPLKYNEILKRCKKLEEDYCKTITYRKPMKGYCETLEDLLVSNHFMDDINRGYKIIKLDTNLSYIKDDTCRLSIDDMKKLMDITSKFYKNHIITKFDKSIDLSKVEYDYLLIRDINSKLYIMIYSSDADILPHADDNRDIIDSFKL